STDFLLRLYHVTPCWQTTDRRLGLAEPPSCFGQPPETILIGNFISLRDPNHVLTFPIVNGATTERLLTGGDFDVESVQRAKDGSLWVGDEFGPFLLHFDSTGVLLDGPYEIPGVRSPNNPFLQPGEPTRAQSSRGFEAISLAPGGGRIYAALEGALSDDPNQL